MASAQLAEGIHVFAIDGALPGPASLFPDLDPLLDDEAVRVVLFDLRNAGSDEGGWGDVACRDLRLWRKPTVCVFDGVLEGDRLAFALACDVRAMGNHARLRFAGTFPAPRLLATLAAPGGAPPERGAELNAADAHREGLVTSVDADPFEAGKRIAGVIASRGPLATQLAKEAIWRGLTLPLEQALRFETDLTLLLQTTKDRAEGVAAFLEKREPQFHGD